MERQMEDLNNILNLVKSYIDNKPNTWEAGKDWVQYAGPFFDSTEYTSGISTLLNGWLVLGEKGISFENQFPKLLNKEYVDKCNKHLATFKRRMCEFHKNKISF
jgi:hypothetical protein